MNGKTMAIILILVNLLLAAAVLVAGVTAEAAPEAAPEAETLTAPETVNVRWATVERRSPVFDDPCWQGELIGSAPMGSAVEVLAEESGWALCWWCTDRIELVWMLTDHLDFME